MVDPNNHKIDPRTKVVNEDLESENMHSAPAYVPASSAASGTATPSACASAQIESRDVGVQKPQAATTVQEEGTEYPKKKGNGWFQGEGNDELIKFLKQKISEYKPADLDKIRRRERAEGVMSGITDAVTSVANLIATHNYAPNMYNGRESMSAKSKERFDKLKADREADDDRHYGYVMAYRRLQDAQEQKEYQRGRDALQDQIRVSQENRAQLKADRDAALAGLRMELMQGKIDAQAAAARAKEIEAEYADQYWEARVKEVNSKTDKNNRWQPSAGRGGGAGGGGKPGEYPWYDSNGNLHYAHTYEAARQNGLNHGTWNEVTQQSTTNRTQADRKGRTKSTTSSTTVKPAKGHSVKPQGKKPNPMGAGTQKKKNPMS